MEFISLNMHKSSCDLNFSLRDNNLNVARIFLKNKSRLNGLVTLPPYDERMNLWCDICAAVNGPSSGESKLCVKRF